MNKYKLINIQTGEEHLCDKVTIDEFDYYVSKTDIGINDYFEVDGQLFQCLTSQEADDLAVSNDYPKVITTNNPNINIPQVVGEVDFLSEKLAKERREKHAYSQEYCEGVIDGYEEGYNKSQETHLFSEEDLKSILDFITNEKSKYSIMYGNQEERFSTIDKDYTIEELIEIWKEQQPKIVYYNE